MLSKELIVSYWRYAFVCISVAPVVLGESTTATPQVLGLADTGSSIIQSAIAGLLIVATALVLFWDAIKAKLKLINKVIANFGLCINK